jgi:histidyl-tRNA synthetase
MEAGASADEIKDADDSFMTSGSLNRSDEKKEEKKEDPKKMKNISKIGKKSSSRNFSKVKSQLETLGAGERAGAFNEIEDGSFVMKRYPILQNAIATN